MSSPFRDAAAVTLDASHRVGQAHVPGAALNGRFHPPTAVKGLVARPRLHHKLTASTATKGSGPGPVGLLSAPAGAGKTLLLADWAREYSRASPDVALAWLTLAERDNNVSILCESLAEAIATSVDAAGQRLPVQTGSRPPVEQWLAHFAETLETHERRTTLILDDVHTLHDPMSIGLLDRILTQTPGNLSIIVAARYEPPLTWHRLALDGRLTRFASTDLAFDRSEITAIFGEYDITLRDDELAIVENFTKGWGAVVRLTAAFLAGRSDIGDALDEFTHTPRPIADFLVDEVLTSLPEHVTSFMLRTSVVDSFSAQLAETLTDSNARSEIDSLIQFNFPVTRTDSADHTTCSAITLSCASTFGQSSVASITSRETAYTCEQQAGSKAITSNSRRSNSRCRSETHAAFSRFSNAAGWASYSTGTAGTSCESWNRCRRRFRNPRSPDWCWRRPPPLR